MRSFAIVIHRAYFEAKKRRNYAKNVVVSRTVCGMEGHIFHIAGIFLPF